MVKQTPLRPAVSVLRTEAVVVAFALMVTVWLLTARNVRMTADVTTGVCVGVSVIGADGGDVGTVDCGETASSVASSVASSTASSASSTSSAVSSSATSASSGEDSTSGDSGGYRHSESWDRWHISALLRRWSARHEAAPSSSSSSSISPSLRLPRDVPADAWYAPMVERALREGLLETADRLFRPGAGATRAEMAVFLVRLSGQPIEPLPVSGHFIDVPRDDWSFGVIERAAANGWFLGYDRCYGREQCVMRPHQIISRAETTAVLMRYYDWSPLRLAPRFPDVPSYAWYVSAVQSAADRCVLRGDGLPVRARPDGDVLRAELIAMILRSADDLRYGEDCAIAIAAAIRRPPTTSQNPMPVRSVAEADLFLADACAMPSVQCVIEALSRDAQSLVASLLSSWSFPGRADLQGTEPILWLLMLFWFVLIIRLVLRFAPKLASFSLHGKRVGS